MADTRPPAAGSGPRGEHRPAEQHDAGAWSAATDDLSGSRAETSSPDPAGAGLASPAASGPQAASPETGIPERSTEPSSSQSASPEPAGPEAGSPGPARTDLASPEPAPAAPSRSIVTQTPASRPGIREAPPGGAGRSPARRSGSGRLEAARPESGRLQPRRPDQRGLQQRSRPQGGPASPAGDMLSGMQRWLIRSSARTMRRELEGQVRRTLGGGRAESKDVWGTATTEPPPDLDQAPECAWCPVCRAARRMRENRPGISSASDAVAAAVQDALGALDGVLSRTAAPPTGPTPADRSQGQGDADSAASDAAERAAHEPGDRS